MKLRLFRYSRLKPLLLQSYRLAVIVTAVFLLRSHFQHLRVQGEEPIELTEVREILPDAQRLSIDPGPRGGLLVFDAEGTEIGYAIRTSPQADHVIGYAGPTDVLVVFGPPDTSPNPPSQADLGKKATPPEPLAEPTRKVLEIRIRRSWDTTRHIQWVRDDTWFTQFWQGRDWENLAGLNFYDEYMEGVSGATLSSMGIARSLQQRVQWSEEQIKQQVPLRISATDYGIGLALIIGLLVTFKGGWKSNRRFWTAIKLAAFVYVGFWNGSLIALSLLSGYAARGVAWQIAPGLVTLVAISFVVPWSTRRQPYCNHICPHGAAQQLLSRWSPWRYSVPPRVAAGLRWIPWLLILVAVVFLIWELPLDLAHLEPFDAYLFRQSDWIPIGLFGISLLISAIIPLAYCKYGCPTGALLEFVRSHGKADHFGRRDLAAALLLVLMYVCIQQYAPLQSWLSAPLAKG